MSWSIGLKGLRIDCIVGVHPSEREIEQPVYLDIDLEGDFAAAAATQALEDAVDYEAAAYLLIDLVVERRFRLLEALADEAAAALLERFPGVTRATVEVRKPSALSHAESAYVRRVRGRGGQEG